MIYVFGDSHSLFFARAHPSSTMAVCNNICATSIGPTTAHNFIDKMDIVEDALVKYEANNNDLVMLSAGEIDCRLHIPKLLLKNNTPAEQLVFNTLNKLLECYNRLIRNKRNIVVMGPHPTKPLLNHKEDFVYGDQQLRNTICILYNNMLYATCKQYQLRFISTMPDLINKDLSVKEEYYFDDLHLDGNSNVYHMFIKKLEDLFK